jgi:hypothetical protein
LKRIQAHAIRVQSLQSKPLIIFELGTLAIEGGDVVSELAEKAIPMLVATFNSLVTLNM